MTAKFLTAAFSKWTAPTRHGQPAAPDTFPLLDRAQIEAYLQATGLKYRQDANGTFVVVFAPTDEITCQLAVVLSATDETYTIRTLADRTFPDRAAAEQACHTWNAAHRWPKAYVVDRDADDQSRIILEEHWFLPHGVPPQILAAFSDVTLTTSMQFWAWLDQEYAWALQMPTPHGTVTAH